MTRHDATLRNTAGIAALIFIWLAATAWARPLALPDEGRYVGVAWEMVRSGSWLTPTLDGLPYFHKPPLFYWITAGSLSIFGVNEWAARVAPLLGATLGALSIYVFMRRWSDEGTARTALIALLAQPLFVIGGQFANLDMLVAGCITATITLLAHAALSLQAGLPHRRALVAAYAFAALGILAKGLIGFVIPGLVILAWLLLRRQWRTVLALLSVPGALVFLLLAAPWFVAMQLRFPDFLDYFFVVQHFKRFAAGGFNNVQPLWFYPAVVVVFSLPCVLWLARLFKRSHWLNDERGAVRLLMLLWLLTVVVFFSLPKSKLLGYVLPAVPPLAVLMAEAYRTQLKPSLRSQRLWALSIGLAVILGLGPVAWLSINHPKSSIELARLLGAQHQPGQPVVMLGNIYFDLPFYARLREPMVIVDNWNDPNNLRNDNWRKELADAGEFAPAAAAAALVNPADLPALLCATPISWVLGPVSAAERFPFVSAANSLATYNAHTLWKFDRQEPALRLALGCDK